MAALGGVMNFRREASIAEAALATLGIGLEAGTFPSGLAGYRIVATLFLHALPGLAVAAITAWVYVRAVPKRGDVS